MMADDLNDYPGIISLPEDSGIYSNSRTTFHRISDDSGIITFGKSGNVIISRSCNGCIAGCRTVIPLESILAVVGYFRSTFEDPDSYFSIIRCSVYALKIIFDLFDFSGERIRNNIQTINIICQTAFSGRGCGGVNG